MNPVLMPILQLNYERNKLESKRIFVSLLTLTGITAVFFNSMIALGVALTICPLAALRFKYLDIQYANGVRQLIRTNGENLAWLIFFYGGQFLQNFSSQDFLAALRTYPRAFDFAPDWMKDNLTIMQEAVRINGEAYLAASERLQNMEPFASQAVVTTPEMFEYLSEQFRTDLRGLDPDSHQEGFVLRTVRENPAIIPYLPPELQARPSLTIYGPVDETHDYSMRLLWISGNVQKCRQIV